MTLDEVQVYIGELESRVDRLRALYEQYFVGLEKLEPLTLRKDIDRRFDILRREQIRNPAQRFRLQMVTQKYTTYLSYWTRVVRKIEEGTYKRDFMRNQRYGKRAEAESNATPGATETAPSYRRRDSDAPELELGGDDAGDDNTDVHELNVDHDEPVARIPTAPMPVAPAARAASGQTAANAAAAATSATASAMSRATGGDDPHVRALYEKFRQTRRANGEGDVSYEALARQVRETIPRLSEKYPGQNISLDVTVKDGKTVLRPIVRKK